MSKFGWKDGWIWRHRESRVTQRLPFILILHFFRKLVEYKSNVTKTTNYYPFETFSNGMPVIYRKFVMTYRKLFLKHILLINIQTMRGIQPHSKVNTDNS